MWLPYLEAVRRYWRRAKARQRAKKLRESGQGFKPRIIQFSRCSLCYNWHPTRAIIRSGRIITVSLDVFHKQPEIAYFEEWMNGLKERDPTETALERCIEWRMQEEGDETEEEAKANCKLLFEDPFSRKIWDEKIERDSYLQTEQEICVRSRMELYHEARDRAEANCKLILEDPLYRHSPQGLIPPMDTDDVSQGLDVDEADEDQIDKNQLMTCFFEKMQEDQDPVEAMQECVRELIGMKGQKEIQGTQDTVGDLYGKTPKQIAAMSKPKDDSRLTLGNLFGKTKKEILEENERSRQQEIRELSQKGKYREFGEFTAPPIIDSRSKQKTETEPEPPGAPSALQVNELERQHDIRRRERGLYGDLAETEYEKWRERRIALAKEATKKKLQRELEAKTA